MQPLSTISKDDFLRLNEFACGEGPAAKQNAANLIDELSVRNRSELMSGCERGTLVVADHTIPKSSGYVSVECILDFPEEMFHPVEQASACLNLLQRLERGESAPKPRHSREEIQRRLSRLMVDYPVLLDSRLVFGVMNPSEDWSTLATALAATAFASLPSPAHGLTERELRLFASRSCVKSGLMRGSPSSSARPTHHRGKTPLEIVEAPATVPSRFGATRGAFLTSLLRLNYYARLMTGRAVLHFGTTRSDVLYRAVAKVFWDVATTGGTMSGITAAEFSDVMKLPSPLAGPPANEGYDPEADHTIATGGIRASDQAPNALQHALAVSVDSGLFGLQDFGLKPDAPMVYLEDAMFARTSGAVDMLVATGSYPTHEAAAKWLCQVSVGALRMWGATAGPACTHEGALGFLAGVGQHGAEATLAGAINTTPSPHPTVVEQRAASIERTWESAISASHTLKTMRGVIERNRSEEPAEPAPRPRPRTRV